MIAFILPDGERSSFEVGETDAMVSLLILRTFNSGAAKEFQLGRLFSFQMRKFNVGWLQDRL